MICLGILIVTHIIDLWPIPGITCCHFVISRQNIGIYHYRIHGDAKSQPNWKISPEHLSLYLASFKWHFQQRQISVSTEQAKVIPCSLLDSLLGKTASSEHFQVAVRHELCNNTLVGFILMELISHCSSSCLSLHQLFWKIYFQILGTSFSGRLLKDKKMKSVP